MLSGKDRLESTDTACVEENEKCNGTYNVILYWPLIKHSETFVQDRILNAKGEVTHFASREGDKGCISNSVTEEKLIPDPDTLYGVQYAPAFSETSTFTVKLSALGTLSEAGTTSTPGGKSLVESFTRLATTIKIPNHVPVETSSVGDSKSKPMCSHGKILLPKSKKRARHLNLNLVYYRTRL
ncbi:MAG: hypothetical protein OQK04_14910 [Kangiellaceae bacterium]|nr:hypothetical protein [Kangiellaceae bacterium]MCW8999998.1 hypothetical protein [Kangiellaceae bacterium]